MNDEVEMSALLGVHPAQFLAVVDIPEFTWDAECVVLYADVRSLWLGNSSASEESFAKYVSLLPAYEQLALKKYHFRSDAVQHLVSLLLQHAVISQLQGIAWKDSRITRSTSGRPSYQSARFDYNVSHHGGLVAIGVRTVNSKRIGVDIVDIDEATKNWRSGWENDFHDVFTENEYKTILSERDSYKIKRRLFTFWALKEAYTKAIGVGLLSDLKSVEFTNVGDIDVSGLDHYSKTLCKVNGEPIDWRFELFALEKTVIMAVATSNDDLLENKTSVKLINLQDIIKAVHSVT
ncbi:4'-phosphopantetheinyl transferase superfamily [Lipomyces japonicus]|uniref:4'-phosphopantetheinyl transferase superfamily n=1 Tax=Lipomyces japonicus TaxID=56871 RepID=UPI0034CEE6F3